MALKDITDALMTQGTSEADYLEARESALAGLRWTWLIDSMAERIARDVVATHKYDDEVGNRSVDPDALAEDVARQVAERTMAAIALAEQAADAAKAAREAAADSAEPTASEA